MQLPWLSWYPAAALCASSSVTNVPLTPVSLKHDCSTGNARERSRLPECRGPEGKAPRGGTGQRDCGLCAGLSGLTSAPGRGRALQSGAGTWTGEQNLQKGRSDSKFTGFLSSYLHSTFRFLLKVTTAFSFIHSFSVQLISFLKSSNGFLSVWGKRQEARPSFKRP